MAFSSSRKSNATLVSHACGTGNRKLRNDRAGENEPSKFERGFKNRPASPFAVYTNIPVFVSISPFGILDSVASSLAFCLLVSSLAESS